MDSSSWVRAASHWRTSIVDIRRGWTRHKVASRENNVKGSKDELKNNNYKNKDQQFIKIKKQTKTERREKLVNSCWVKAANEKQIYDSWIVECIILEGKAVALLHNSSRK